jgi:hypothetical protein
MFQVKRARKVAFVVSLILALPITYVLASFVPPSPEKTEPEIMGTFTVNVEVHNVKDLYAWQILLTYDPYSLILIDVTPGGFIGSVLINESNGNVQDVFARATDIGQGLLLIGGSLIGNVSGKDGCGLLAKVTFGYLSIDYSMPQIVFDKKPYETKLISSNGDTIQIDNETLKLHFEEH